MDHSLLPFDKGFRSTPEFYKILESEENGGNLGDNNKKKWKKHLENLEKKFNDEKGKIEGLDNKPEYFKGHKLPLARIKKIMKADEDVKVNIR